MANSEEVIEQSPENNNGKNGKKKIVIILLVIAVIAGAVFGVRWLIFRMNYTTTDDAQVDADIIPLSFKVPGRISEVFVKEGDTVTKGQKIAALDDTDYKLALRQARARLDMARSELEKQETELALTRTSSDIGVRQSKTSLGQEEDSVSISSTQRELNLTSLKAQVDRARINLDSAILAVSEIEPLVEQAKNDFERAENLFHSGVISEEQHEKTETNKKSLESRLSQAQKRKEDAKKQLDVAESNLKAEQIDDLRVGIARQGHKKADLALELSRDEQARKVAMAETEVHSLEAHIRELKAGLEQAETALKETVMVSPVHGIAARKLSLSAEIVQAGKPVYFLVDRGDVYVEANIEEKYLGRFGIGSEATVTIDALPGKKFKGRVVTIGAAANSKFSLIPASNPTGQFIKVTQRIPVKIRVSGDLSRLKPGMNAIVSIKNR